MQDIKKGFLPDSNLLSLTCKPPNKMQTNKTGVSSLKKWHNSANFSYKFQSGSIMHYEILQYNTKQNCPSLNRIWSESTYGLLIIHKQARQEMRFSPATKYKKKKFDIGLLVSPMTVKPPTQKVYLTNRSLHCCDLILEILMHKFFTLNKLNMSFKLMTIFVKWNLHL